MVNANDPMALAGLAIMSGNDIGESLFAAAKAKRQQEQVEVAQQRQAQQARTLDLRMKEIQNRSRYLDQFQDMFPQLMGTLAGGSTDFLIPGMQQPVDQPAQAPMAPMQQGVTKVPPMPEAVPQGAAQQPGTPRDAAMVDSVNMPPELPALSTPQQYIASSLIKENMGVDMTPALEARDKMETLRYESQMDERNRQLSQRDKINLETEKNRQGSARKMFEEITADARVANKGLTQLQSAKIALAEGAEPSPTAGFTTYVTELMNGLGFDVDVSEAVSNRNLERAGNELALGFLANFKGAISDAERQFVVNLAPNIGTSKQSALQFINFMEQKYKDQVNLGRHAMQINRKDPSLKNFMSSVQEFENQTLEERMQEADNRLRELKKQSALESIKAMPPEERQKLKEQLRQKLQGGAGG